MTLAMRIGIDFDNTLAGYDGVFSRLACEWGLSAPGSTLTKLQVRELARQQDELLWQRIQGEVYGPRMQQAEQFEGVDSFLTRCAAAGGIEVCIVSHKTQFGHFDETNTDLRIAARSWMKSHGFFDRYGIVDQNLYFESTQTEKVQRIAQLRCDLFIDDLPELFEHPDFPAATRKILFSPGNAGANDAVTRCASWHQIEVEVFGS